MAGSSSAKTCFALLPGHDGENWQDSIIPGYARERAFDDVADRLPGIAVELHQAQLLDGTEIRRPGVDGDARQRHRALVVPQRRRLPHDVLAREVVAALAQDLEQGLGRGVAEDGVAVVL